MLIVDDMIAAKVSKRGMIVLPKKIRDKLNIKAGDTIIFKIIKGRIVLEVERTKLKDILKAGRPIQPSVEFQRSLRSEWT